MMNGRPWFVSGVAALVCWLLMGSAQAAGLEGAISRQEDIITQKSQDIASRRREEENQYRLRDTMTRTDSSSASLEAFFARRGWRIPVKAPVFEALFFFAPVQMGGYIPFRV